MASYQVPGFLLACGKEGPALEKVQLRIGGYRETETDNCAVDRRGQAIHLCDGCAGFRFDSFWSFRREGLE